MRVAIVAAGRPGGGSAMSRLSVANELGCGEQMLRAAEDRGDLPRYSEATRSSYRDFAYVWLSARSGGASPEAIRRVMGSFTGGKEEVPVPQDSVYSDWRMLHMSEPDGTPVSGDKRRCQLLLPHALRLMGHAVAIPAGSAADFALPDAARDARWWGSESGGQWFFDECYRFGLINGRVDVPAAIRTGKEGSK